MLGIGGAAAVSEEQCLAASRERGRDRPRRPVDGSRVALPEEAHRLLVVVQRA